MCSSDLPAGKSLIVHEGRNYGEIPSSTSHMRSHVDIQRHYYRTLVSSRKSTAATDELLDKVKRRALILSLSDFYSPSISPTPPHLSLSTSLSPPLTLSLHAAITG